MTIVDDLNTLPNDVYVDYIDYQEIQLNMYAGSDIHPSIKRVSEWFFFQKSFTTAHLDHLNGMNVTFEKNGVIEYD